MAAFALGVLACCGSTASAQTNVTPNNLHGWQTRIVTGAGPVDPTISFVTGPGSPTCGTGSIEFKIGSDGDAAAELRNPNYAGVKVLDILSLSYTTYVQQWVDNQVPYLILNVDLDGDGIPDDLLFFEPVYQSATFFPSFPQSDPVLGAWQTWDARNGGWWSVSGTAGANPGTDVKSLDTILASYPNAKIINSGTGLGGLRIVTGFGAGAWEGFIGNVDCMTISVDGIGSTTFNFDPNHAPTANAQSVSTYRNQAKAITLSGSDQDGDTITYSITQNPAHGSISGFNASTGDFTYTPTAGYAGPDCIKFKTNDGLANSAAAKVSITVVNRAPAADAQSVSTLENTPRQITMTGSDPDGDPLTFVICSGPAHGTISGSSPNFTYTPALDYYGPDCFKVKAYDGVDYSASVKISINVIPVPQDRTSRFTITRGGFRKNNTTKRFEQVITVKNTSGSTVTGPVYLLVENLSANASLYNKTGNTTQALPLGTPYVLINGGNMAAGASVQKVLEFTNPSNAAITYTSRIIAGPGTP
jgi:hypothetical protein